MAEGIMKKLGFGAVWALGLFAAASAIGYTNKNLERSPRSMSPNIWLWNKSLKSFTDLRPQSALLGARNSNNLFYDSIKNSVIQVLVHNMDSYLIINSNTSHLEGFLGDIWNILEEILGFRSNITKVYFDNGRDVIKRREADVFLAALVYTKNTTKMRFSQPFIRTWYHLYFKLPEGKPADYLHFKAINLKLWIYILSLFALITVCLWITTFTLNKAVPGLDRLSSIFTYFLGVISAFLNTGYDLRLRSFTARLLILLALIFGVLCYYALSASLVASLAVMDRKMPFTALTQLRNQKTFSLCLRNITFVYDNFTDLNRKLLPQWVNVANTKYCPRDMVNWKTISAAICQDNVAVLENRIIMAWALQNVECEVAMLPQRYFDVGNFIVFSESFKNTKAIAVMMLRMRSAGIARKLETKWVKSAPSTSPPSITGANQITFSHIKGLISIYMTMVAITLLVLLAEIVWAKIH